MQSHNHEMNELKHQTNRRKERERQTRLIITSPSPSWHPSHHHLFHVQIRTSLHPTLVTLIANRTNTHDHSAHSQNETTLSAFSRRSHCTCDRPTNTQPPPPKKITKLMQQVIQTSESFTATTPVINPVKYHSTKKTKTSRLTD